jgi:hypothetical protein
LHSTTVHSEHHNIIIVIAEISQNIAAVIARDDAAKLLNNAVRFFITLIADNLIAKE